MTSKVIYHTCIHQSLHILVVCGVRSSGLGVNRVTRGSVGVQHVAINPSTAVGRGTLTQAAVVRGELKASRADGSSALVHGVPVASNRRVLGKRQVGLGLLNLSGLVGVLVDDGLGRKYQYMTDRILLTDECSSPSFERYQSWQEGCHREIEQAWTQPCGGPER